jgi:hypothetical protein
MNTNRYLPYVTEINGWFYPVIEDTLTGTVYLNQSVSSPDFEMIASIADEWNEAYSKQLQTEIGFSMPQTDYSSN